jgi:hypothetical protein
MLLVSTAVNMEFPEEIMKEQKCSIGNNWPILSTTVEQLREWSFVEINKYYFYILLSID